MGQISDFFIASPEEFGDVLDGWQHPPEPLKDAVEREAFNPFTKQPLVFRSRQAPQPEPKATGVVQPSVHKLPCVRWKNVGPETLAIARSHFAGIDLDTASEMTACDLLIGPEGAGDLIYVLPQQVVVAISVASALQLERLAKRIEASQSESFPTVHKGSWTGHLELLEQLRSLAELAVGSGRAMYLWLPGEPTTPQMVRSTVFADDNGIREESDDGAVVAFAWDEIEKITSYLLPLSAGPIVATLTFESSDGSFIEFWSPWDGFDAVALELASRLPGFAVDWREKVEARSPGDDPILVWQRKRTRRGKPTE